MNKYKMISICSFTVVCVLIMSLLLPIKTIANDEESIELNMNYADSKITLDIEVNSDVYTGIVCKYLMLDNVLVEEDLVTKTKENGTTINLDKTENDKYNTIIKDVNKRYVVVYVSIGNCSLCDYIDCKPNKEENKTEQPAENKEENKTEQPAENKEENETEQPTENKEENKTEQPTENKEENKTEQPAENKEENKTEQPAENREENKTEQPAENKEENKTEQPAENKEENKTEQPAESKEENKINQPSNNTQTTNNTQQKTSQKPNQTNSNGINLNNYNTNSASNGSSSVPVSGDKDSINVSNNMSGDKDSIDTSDFQEIEKTVTTSTADGNMPKTGEDDFIKILGIVVFSALSVMSFYKYKKTK